jgi:ABC-type polysaccharide/polyol phosphate transport system ATPase subunit
MTEPALVLTGIIKRFPDPPSCHGISSVLKELACAAGLAFPETLPKRGRSVIQSVDLTLSSGEIAILLGPPGCGKTSLLKIAAGLMRPTAGVVHVEGGSSSLIYPKCGLHTALTGRANIILRALMEGLPISEARARCAPIAQFAEIDDLFDRPVREYSEVILARLAFGAMAFLDARVLIWDDVLERCDPTFRQKCLALIPTLLREGKSILMATHDVGKTEEISPRAIWIEEGRVRMDGPSRDVLDRYLEARVKPAPIDPPGVFAGASRLAAVELLDEQGKPATCYLPGDPITVAVELELRRRVEQPYFLLSIAGAFGPIAAASMFHDGCRPASIEGMYRIECTFEKLFLAPRQHFTVRFALYAEDGTTILHPKRVIASFVTGGSAAACGFFHESAEGRILGAPPVLANYRWRMPGGIDKAWTTAAIAFPSSGVNARGLGSGIDLPEARHSTG